jgi:hypothetical protein
VCTQVAIELDGDEQVATADRLVPSVTR